MVSPLSGNIWQIWYFRLPIKQVVRDNNCKSTDTPILLHSSCHSLKLSQCPRLSESSSDLYWVGQSATSGAINSQWCKHTLASKSSAACRGILVAQFQEENHVCAAITKIVPIIRQNFNLPSYILCECPSPIFPSLCLLLPVKPIIGIFQIPDLSAFQYDRYFSNHVMLWKPCNEASCSSVMLTNSTSPCCSSARPTNPLSSWCAFNRKCATSSARSFTWSTKSDIWQSSNFVFLTNSSRKPAASAQLPPLEWPTILLIWGRSSSLSSFIWPLMRRPANKTGTGEFVPAPVRWWTGRAAFGSFPGSCSSVSFFEGSNLTGSKPSSY